MISMTTLSILLPMTAAAPATWPRTAAEAARFAKEQNGRARRAREARDAEHEERLRQLERPAGARAASSRGASPPRAPQGAGRGSVRPPRPRFDVETIYRRRNLA